jgi:DNA-binding Xre family transcriptional regulator
MLSFNIKAIMKARGVEKHLAFLLKSGLSRTTATRLLNGELTEPKLEHIEKLCIILICEPNDLFVWKQNKDQIIDENHPIFKLKSTEMETDLIETIRSIPYSELKDLNSKIKKQ